MDHGSFQSQERLDSWKEIASYLKRDRRTAQRWERERGLPVHRIPGYKRSAVFAFVEELELWLSGHADKSWRQSASDFPQGPRQREWGPARDRSYPVNAEAHQEYLKGRYFWNKRGGGQIRRAIEHFRAAIRLDQDYALAYVGVAEAFLVLGYHTSMPTAEAYAEAKRAVLKALEIDPDLAEAHASLACIKAGHDWDLPGALQAFEHALALEPGYATTHQWYAEHLACVGRVDQAVAEARRALKLDPTSLAINASAGLVLGQARRHEESVAQLKGALEIDKNFGTAHWLLGDVYLEMGRFEAAIKEHGLAAVLRGEPGQAAEARSVALSGAFRKGGEDAYWSKRLELAAAAAEPSSYELAMLYAKLEKTEAAVEHLKATYQRRDYNLLYLGISPAFDTLHNHPAVKGLMKRIGLPN